MKIVFGLGNPGAQYEHSRHNAGFDVVERVAAFFQKPLKKRCFRLYRRFEVSGAIIAEPLTYMNSSGEIVRFFSKHINAENAQNLLVISDNMDLAVGGLRIRKGGGTGGQNGLKSIAEKLGSFDFIRIYVGTGRPADGVSVVDHVLGKETDPVMLEAYNKALDDAAKAVIRFLNGATVEELQSEFNRKGLC